MSNLVNHAKRELELLDEDTWLTSGILKIVQDFADMGHSGSSAAHTIGVLSRLLQFKNLTPLTDDPYEWNHVHREIWQNARDPEAFSNDKGKTYYILSEGGDDQHREPLHISEHKGD